jgi:carboxyl-terminal processing protease
MSPQIPEWLRVSRSLGSVRRPALPTSGATEQHAPAHFRGALRRHAARLVLATLGGAAVLSAGEAVAAGENSPFSTLATFARALAHIDASYVGEVDRNTLVYGAIRGMVRALDPHSEYLDPDEYRVLVSDTRGRFAGIGVEIDVRDGWLTVSAVFPGSPAERAGVRVGDRFLAIDGHRARDMPIEEAVRRMRGEPQSEVRVALRREDQGPQIDLLMRREMLSVDAVEAKLLSGDVLYVRLRVFQETVARELADVLDHAEHETQARGGIRGVLLDLRDNPGGLLDQAVAVADEFLEEGVIVSTRGRGGRELAVAHAQRTGTRPGYPAVVLVNGYTASAAEIVAAALRDHGRAVVVGTRTFGKGSVQNIIELPDHSALKLTIARYYTPTGQSIQARGIDPDVVVQQLLPGATLPAGAFSEAQLEGHLDAGEAAPQAVSAGVARDARRRASGAEGRMELEGDFQARMALETLRAIGVDRAAQDGRRGR